ncbi:unnamed protein product, partial [Ascophyllum nodosum]
NPNASPASHLPHATVHNDTRAIQALKVASTVLVWERDGLHRFYLRRYRVLQD